MQASGKSLTEAAVLLPVYRDEDGKIRLVLVRRSKGGIHGGQIAFPGGKREPGDRTILATALREAGEEIGLAPEKVEVLASLPAVETLTSGFMIFPFLARITPPVKWRRSEREIAEIIEMRLDDLVRPEIQGEEIKEFPTWSGPRSTPFYRIGNYKIWGATYRILRPLIDRLLSGEWPI